MIFLFITILLVTFDIKSVDIHNATYCRNGYCGSELTDHNKVEKVKTTANDAEAFIVKAFLNGLGYIICSKKNHGDAYCSFQKENAPTSEACQKNNELFERLKKHYHEQKLVEQAETKLKLKTYLFEHARVRYNAQLINAGRKATEEHFENQNK